MTAQVAVDAEKLVVDWLRTVDEVTDIFDARIYTEVPARDVEWPLLRVIRIGGAPTTRLARLDSPLMQLDVWGGPKATARLGLATALAHMATEMPGAHDLGVVTAVEVGGPQWLPDTEFTPARPRYSADVRLWTHP